MWVDGLGVLWSALGVDQVLGLGGEPLAKILSEELGQWSLQIGRADAAVEDPEPLEHRLVELPFHGRGCCPVKGVAVLAERENLVQDAIEVAPFSLAQGKGFAGTGQGPVDAGLFFLEELLGDRVVVVGAHARAALVFEVGDGFLLAGGLFGAVGREGLGAGDDEFPDACLVSGRDLDAAPPFLDKLFHGADENVRLAAFSALAA
ncbi:hypothetical protein CcI49_07965 [Frankia sp. CcI49]|uniref:hypothetical protein n=1 Tax=Frankia sp. CcI49 TaxID=1745382 RepID=UPI0009782C32|nr:hypothetical protein [Frankia sp. CcI49]ONH61049.1 hypothetical protein CcI49_07965 [Frankia sp. CcI49]